jgi:hypothetical protein
VRKKHSSRRRTAMRGTLKQKKALLVVRYV